MKTENNLKLAGWILFFAWTISLAILFGLANYHIMKETRAKALVQSRAHLSKDVAFRHWAATHGGFYVPVTRETPPNPYLAHIDLRDIKSPDGTSLTLMNPAYATRQLNEAFPRTFGVFGHLTSLKLLRPENAPDQWETASLHKFEEGEKEIYEFTDIDGEPYLRLIHPLTIEENCLKCHSHQGYALGEVRGGVAVSLSMKDAYAREQQSQIIILLLFSGLWALGTSLIVLGSKKLARAYRMRDESLQRLETLYQKSTDGILLIKDGEFIDCNEAAMQMSGYTAKTEILGFHPADLSPAEQPDGRASREKADEMMQLCLDQGSNRFEWVHRDAQGGDSWVEVVLTRIELQDIPLIHVAWRDINTFKNDQEELAEHRHNLENMLVERTTDLRESRNAFQQLVNDMGDNFVVFSYVGTTGELTFVSNGVTSVFGLSREEVIGKPWGPLVDWYEEDIRLAESEIQKLLAGQITFSEMELHFMHPEKGARTLHSLTHVIQKDADGPILIGGILEDITELKQIHQQLKDAEKRAVAANKQKSQFLANMSHEIRTPMNAMIGLSELALETNLTDQQHDYLSKIHSSSLGLLTILNDILDFSKIEAGKITLEERVFSLPEMIDGLGFLFDDQAQQKGLGLLLEIDSAVPSFLYGDSFRLRQVLVNIVGNALKFTEEGNVAVNVSLLSQTEKQVQLQFSIVDSGIGISADKLTRLFKAFSQVDASYTRKYGGTGLGLAISKELMERMGGRLEVRSEKGEGSTFTILVDLGKVEQEEMILQGSQNKEAEKKKTAMKCIAGIHILLVEDDAINRQVASEILHQAGAHVETAVNGEEAVEEYRSALRETIPFSAILMDIQMPILNGYKATAKIRAYEREQLDLSSHIPIIAMTAQTMVGDQKKCLAAGMDDYIAKPVNSADLFITLAKWIASNAVGETASPRLAKEKTEEQKRSAAPQLPDVLPGVDLEDGLARLEGNEDLYLSLLRKFGTEQSGTARKIEENLQKNKLAEGRQLLHTVKGLAGNLGALALARAALNLENVLDQEGDSALFLDSFMDCFDEVFVSITTLLPEERGQKKQSAAVNYHHIVPLLEELLSMLAANHFNATVKWQELKPLFQGEESGRVTRIDSYISAFEFEPAMELLDEIISRMRAAITEGG